MRLNSNEGDGYLDRRQQREGDKEDMSLASATCSEKTRTPSSCDFIDVLLIYIDSGAHAKESSPAAEMTQMSYGFSGQTERGHS